MNIRTFFNIIKLLSSLVSCDYKDNIYFLIAIPDVFFLIGMGSFGVLICPYFLLLAILMSIV